MITLGIETSCDETAVSILNGRKILAETVSSSARFHSRYGGVVPEIASRKHLETLLPCLDTALGQAGIPLSKIQLIAVTQGPGLMGSLLVGVSAAKALALATGKPLIGVDHVLAHAFSGQLMQRRITFPFMGLVVSGGHTLLIHWKALQEIQIIGRTFDDAVGEAFDKVAKMMDLGYPGGPIIDRLAASRDPSIYRFPRPWIREKHYHFSFSGLKTAVLYQIRSIEAKRKLTRKDKAEIASGFQEAACDVLLEKTFRACIDRKVKILIVGGGVSANSRLRQKFNQRSHKSNIKVIFPSMNLSLDNATMIAALGQAMYDVQKSPKSGSARMRQALDLKAYSDFFVQKN